MPARTPITFIGLRRRSRFVLALAGALSLGLLFLPQPASAATCSYNASTFVVTIELAAGEQATLSTAIGVPRAITVKGGPCGDANVENTDRINVTGPVGATSETLVVDLSNGDLAPGQQAEGGGTSEIEVLVDLGAGASDAVELRGKITADNFRLGGSGINLNGDGDADIFSPDGVTLYNAEVFRVLGGEGGDTISGAGAAGSGAVFPSPLALTGGNGADTLTGGSNNDSFDEGTASNGADVLNGGDGVDTANYGARTTAITVTLDNTANDGQPGTDIPPVPGEGDNVREETENVISGTGNDSLTGSAGNNTLTAGDGTDTLSGGQGNDTLNGGAGNDTLNESGATPTGADVLNGGEGDADLANYGMRTGDLSISLDGIPNDGDVATAEGDNVQSDVENVTGGAGADAITGSAAPNVLTGNEAADTLAGGLGNDTLNGSAGTDTFNEGAAANGADVMNGGAGEDTATYGSRVAAVTVTLDGAPNDGDPAANGGTGEVDDVEVDVENVTTGGGADTVTGSAVANVLTGGGSGDTLNGGDGADTLNGGAGADTLNGGLAADTENGDADNDTFDQEAAANGGDVLSGGDGVDTVNYGARTTIINVTLDNNANDGVPAGVPQPPAEADNVRDDVENVITGAMADTVTGSASANVITTNGGADILNGGAGNDTLNGGAGNDTLTGGADNDIENGEGDNDTFNQEAAANGGDFLTGGDGSDTANYSARTLSLSITMDNAAGDGEAGEGDTVRPDFEIVLAGSGADRLFGLAGNTTLTGGGGNDFIAGGTGTDILNGGEGDDTFFEGNAASGNDIINGGAGTMDVVQYLRRMVAVNVSLDNVANDGAAGEADDVRNDVENVQGGRAGDTIVGSASANVLSGGGGPDTITGGTGEDTLNGGKGGDLFFADDNAIDTLNGSRGFDRADVDDPHPGTDITDSVEQFI